MSDLSIENLNKSTVVLSNGLEMKKGDKSILIRMPKVAGNNDSKSHSKTF
jgi:hypothetical protein